MAKELPKSLPANFYSHPHCAETTMTTKELKPILLNSMGGKILTHGQLWRIKNENLGCGVKRVYLVKAD